MRSTLFAAVIGGAIGALLILQAINPDNMPIANGYEFVETDIEFQEPQEELQPATDAVEPVNREPVSVVSAAIKAATVASGPTYAGPPVAAGFRTEMVPVQRPVMKQAIYQTVQEQVPYQVQSTRYRTETRQRTKTVMVPQQVTENYNVQVPECVTETKYRTVNRTVKVGEREVAAPVAAAPAPCSPCEPAPTFSVPVQTSQPCAPEPTFSITPECEPAYEQYAVDPCQPQYSQPVMMQTKQRNRWRLQLPVRRETVQVSAPVRTTRGRFRSKGKFSGSGQCINGQCYAP